MPVSMKALNEYLLLPVAGNCALIPLLQMGLNQLAPQTNIKPIALATGFIAQRIFDDVFCYYCPKFSDETRGRYKHLTYASEYLISTMRSVARALIGAIAYQTMARKYPKTPLPTAIQYLALPVSVASYMYMNNCTFSREAIKNEVVTLATNSYASLREALRRRYQIDL